MYVSFTYIQIEKNIQIKSIKANHTIEDYMLIFFYYPVKLGMTSIQTLVRITLKLNVHQAEIKSTHRQIRDTTLLPQNS